MRCPSCGEENPDRAKFCLNCGAVVTPDVAPHEVRKTVTILFSDVTDSTSIGERLDPETLRRVMAQYFDAMRAVIERHGGTVEKFIGDAVMAVFGIPRTHEDDAIRAVRAAVEMARARDTLNGEFSRTHGVSIQARTGINTGEVVTANASGGQFLVTGDTVNVAARLEQAAPPRETLLGRETYRLVRDAVAVEDVEPLELKGKSERVPAFRLVGLDESAAGVTRRTDTTFVGRDRERRLLVEAFDRVRNDRSSYLFTVLGIAGVGKSRLVAEALAELSPDATVVSGRCLPYGEGITFWPLVEIVKEAAGIQEGEASDAVRRKMSTIVEGEVDAHAVEEKLAALLGLSVSTGVLEETFWAARRFLEALARNRPLIVVIDDLHWAEPALLDLVEHVADWSRDTPILLICLARPEFLDARPGWSGGKMNATSILLEPLGPDDAERLVRNLLENADAPPGLEADIVRSADGNPLFVEEVLSMLIDEGHLWRAAEGGWALHGSIEHLELPSSIQVLLAARLDRLAPTEITIIEGAAVVGQVFYRGAVSELCPESLRPDIGTYLKGLIHKDLVRPEAATLPGDESYRFRHILIRDAAYRSMPKETRADLHERFARWLERRVEARPGEYQEIVGYHLEQSYRYREELGHMASELEELGTDTMRHLGASGLRARSRGDMGAARSILERAVALGRREDVERIRLIPALADALVEAGKGPEALRLVDEALHIVGDDSGTEARLQLVKSEIEEPLDFDRAVAEREVLAAIEVLQAAGDDVGLAEAWRRLAWIYTHWEGRSAQMRESLERAAAQWHQLGNHGAEGQEVAWLLLRRLLGPDHLDGVIDDAERAEAEFDDAPAARAQILWTIALARAMQGDIDEARALLDRSRRIEEGLGRAFTAIHFGTLNAAFIERLAGNDEARIKILQDGSERFSAATGEGYNPEFLAWLAKALADAGRFDEARRTIEASPKNDASPVRQLLRMMTMALVIAQEQQYEEAERLARKAVDEAKRASMEDWTLEGLECLADVLRAADKGDDRRQVLEDMRGRAERKGAAAIVRRAEVLLRAG